MKVYSYSLQSEKHALKLNLTYGDDVMNKIALIACTKSKKGVPCKASDMYLPSLRFRLAYEYAQTFADDIYILSAKYGLIHHSEVIEPYDLTLNDQNKEYKRIWTDNVVERLNDVTDIDNDEYIIIAGKNYYEELVKFLRYFTLPLEGMRLGEGNSYLMSILDTSGSVTAEDLHDYFSGLKHYDGSIIREVPFKNGIYVMFDKSEYYKGEPRIVRVGTHTGADNLKTRLRNHFNGRNQRSSIFRKNIGRCLLTLENNTYLDTWNQKDKGDLYDKATEERIETEVTEYLDRISFVCFEVRDKVQRLRLEDGIISVLSKDENYCASEDWLGNESPKKEIRKSGLWCVHGVDGNPLTRQEFIGIQNRSSLNSSNDENKPDAKQSYARKNTEKINGPAKNHDNADKVGTEDVRVYILEKIAEMQSTGTDYIDVKAGDVAKELNVKQRTPTICGGMRKAMEEQDEILYAPPKGNGTRFTVRYYKR